MLENVAAIFRQISPDFPKPVTTTLPLTVVKQFNGLDKAIVKAIDQRNNARRFDVQHLFRSL